MQVFTEWSVVLVRAWIANYANTPSLDFRAHQPWSKVFSETFSLLDNENFTWWLNHVQEYFWKAGSSMCQEGSKDVWSEVFVYLITFSYKFDCIHNEVTAKIDYVVLVSKQVTFFLHRCSNGCLNKNRRKPGRRFSYFRNFGHYHKLLKSKCRKVLFIRMSKRAKQKYCSRVSSMWCKRVLKMCSLRFSII